MDTFKFVPRIQRLNELEVSGKILCSFSLVVSWNLKGIWWIMFCTYVLSWEMCKFDVNEMIEYFLWYCAVALALWVSASCSDGWALHWSCCVDLLSLAQTSSKSAILNFGEYCWEMCFFPKYILSKWYFWWQNVTVDFSVCKLCFFEKISTKVRKILLPFFCFW